MEKILVDFPEIKVSEFKSGEETVKVKNYITIKEEVDIVSAYLDVYFNAEEDSRYAGLNTHFSGAEITFDIIVLDVATNIDVMSDKIEMDDVYSSGLMNTVRGLISNLPQIRRRLERIVADAKQERYSATGLLKEFTSAVSNFDFSKIQDAAKEIKKLESDVADSPISSLMDEVKK